MGGRQALGLLAPVMPSCMCRVRGGTFVWSWNTGSLDKGGAGVVVARAVTCHAQTKHVNVVVVRVVVVRVVRVQVRMVVVRVRESA